MNAFDSGILQFLNQFARRSLLFDVGVSNLLGFELLKGGVFMMVAAWLWNVKDDRARARNREILLASIFACVLAFVMGRVLTHALPFRFRPVVDPDLGFVMPYGDLLKPKESWSAFPSDHGMLFAALSTGMFYISRPLGIASFAYSTIMIFFPRVYLGWHYPTDIVAGVGAGIASGWIANQTAVRPWITTVPLRWLAASPGSFHAVAFALALQIATMFNGGFTLVLGAKYLRNYATGRVEAPRLAEPPGPVSVGH